MQFRIIKRVAVFAVTVLLLAACNTVPQTQQLAPAERAAALQNLQLFRVTGGLSIWSPEESIATRLDWRQAGDDFNVLVTAPAGLTSVRLSQQGGSAVVQRQGDQPIHGSSAADLLRRSLGLPVSVPIRQMSLWIRGLPGAASKVQYDRLGRLASMEYRDSQNTLWFAKVLNYTRYQQQDVPERINATGGPYNVRLVLKSWSEIDSLGLDASQKPSKSTGRLSIPGK